MSKSIREESPSSADASIAAGLAEERRRAERVAERMQTLAALSHKINNPLTALLGRAQLLKLQQGTDPSVCKAAEVIEASSRRIADYVQELALIVKEARGEALEWLVQDESDGDGNGVD